jgi:NFU1 iron-sulfur cluster scaffold homolog, mitochondrial
MSLPVTIYAEATPNPSAMKFVCNMLLMEEGVVEYHDPADAKSCPLALQLFSFTGVKGVFITSNFITITKDPEIDWYEITGILREFIRGYLASGEKLFISNPFSSADKKPVQPENKTTGEITATNNPEIEERIIRMLEEYVKPAVEQDGGAIHLLLKVPAAAVPPLQSP